MNIRIDNNKGPDRIAICLDKDEPEVNAEQADRILSIIRQNIELDAGGIKIEPELLLSMINDVLNALPITSLRHTQLTIGEW